VLLAERTLIRREELAPGAAGPSGPARFDELTLEEVEKVLIQKALARAGGNVSEAAKGLGLSRSALYRRLERYGL
jgi:transcriptional regulator of acetoin/glycerol metabolism